MMTKLKPNLNHIRKIVICYLTHISPNYAKDVECIKEKIKEEKELVWRPEYPCWSALKVLFKKAKNL